MIQLPEAVKAYFDATNQAQPEVFLAAFDENAHLVDHKREFAGSEAIGKWSISEVFAPNVRFEITDAAEHDGAYVVIASLDGDFDKTNLPDPLLMQHTFTLRDGKIKELYITFP